MEGCHFADDDRLTFALLRWYHMRGRRDAGPSGRYHGTARLSGSRMSYSERLLPYVAPEWYRGRWTRRDGSVVEFRPGEGYGLYLVDPSTGRSRMILDLKKLKLPPSPGGEVGWQALPGDPLEAQYDPQGDWVVLMRSLSVVGGVPALTREFGFIPKRLGLPIGYQWLPERQVIIYLTRLPAGQVREVERLTVRVRDAGSPVLVVPSPDGRHLAYCIGNRVYVKKLG